MKNKHLENSGLFSAVTHEIKNSLNPVINLSSILLRNSAGKLTADENSYLEVIERNGRKILNLVDEFSFLSRISGKNKKHEDTSVDVKDLIENSLSKMIELAGHSDCELVCEISDDSSFVITEKDIFRRMLENICLFFISSGGDTPSIYFKADLSESEFNLVISRKKTDFNMTGKSLLDSSKIIEKGFIGSSVMWMQFALLFADYMNGHVYFSGDKDAESVFLFSIPAGCAENVVHNEDTADEDIDHYSGREFILLVIDDDIDNIIPINAIIEHEFKGKGKVYHAESGGKGLDMLEKIQPDIILLDLTLPDISGLSLVRNIKHLFVKKNVPVIAFSGLHIAEDREKMIKSGFDDVIKKPFNIDALVHKIRKWID